jgi:DNA topoisomerase-3
MAARGGGGGRQRVVLSVAEKPSVAKGVATILAGGGAHPPGSRNGRSPYNRIYELECDVGDLGRCRMNMTSVSGHLQELEFQPPYE